MNIILSTMASAGRIDCEVLCKWENLFFPENGSQEAFVEGVVEYPDPQAQTTTHRIMKFTQEPDMGLGALPYKDLIFDRIKIKSGAFSQDEKTTPLDTTDQVQIANSKGPKFNIDTCGFADNTVFKLLKIRADNGFMYSQLGVNTYIVVNPIDGSRVKGNGSERQIKANNYMGSNTFTVGDASMQSLAAKMIHTMAVDEKDCTLSASGISGSGKTYNTSVVLESLFTNVKRDIFDVVEKGKALLEIFGNAHTVNNPNSSRYVQFMTINYEFPHDSSDFDAKNYIQEYSTPTSLKFENSLLQTTQATNISSYERFFHIYHVILLCHKNDAVSINFIQQTMFPDYSEENVKKIIDQIIIPFNEYAKNNFCKDFFRNHANYYMEDVDQDRRDIILKMCQDGYFDEDQLKIFQKILRTVLFGMGLVYLQNIIHDAVDKIEEENEPKPPSKKAPVLVDYTETKYEDCIIALLNIFFYTEPTSSSPDVEWINVDEAKVSASSATKARYPYFIENVIDGPQVRMGNNNRRTVGLVMVQKLFKSAFTKLGTLVNAVISDTFSNLAVDSRWPKVRGQSIRILDIFGFEQRFVQDASNNKVANNGLTQLLINFANEKIESVRYNYIKSNLAKEGFQVENTKSRLNEDQILELEDFLSGTGKTSLSKATSDNAGQIRAAIFADNSKFQGQPLYNPVNRQKVNHYTGIVEYDWQTIFKENGFPLSDGFIKIYKDLRPQGIFGDISSTSISGNNISRIFVGKIREFIEKAFIDKNPVLFNLRNLKPMMDIENTSPDAFKVEELLFLQQLMSQNILDLYYLLMSKTTLVLRFDRLANYEFVPEDKKSEFDKLKTVEDIVKFFTNLKTPGYRYAYDPKYAGILKMKTSI